jgi:hypothetical protein
MLVVAAVGCVDAARYDGAQFDEGIDIDVVNADDLIATATVFFAESQPWFEPAMTPEPSTTRVIAKPTDEYDWVVVYPAGPFCGRLPTVDASVDASDDLVIGITPVSPLEDESCEALEYIEGLGLTLRDDGRDVAAFLK